VSSKIGILPIFALSSKKGVLPIFELRAQKREKHRYLSFELKPYIYLYIFFGLESAQKNIA
jgi:hypothetical protein